MKGRARGRVGFCYNRPIALVARCPDELDKGANPWAPLWENRRDPTDESNKLPQAGLMPLVHLLATRAWPLLDLLL